MTVEFAAFTAKVIYVFRIKDAAHQGCLKIGETSYHGSDINALPPNCAELNAVAHQRIKQYTQTAAIDYELLHTELAQIVTKEAEPGKPRALSYRVSSFSDYDVHQVLLRSGIKRKHFDLKHKANEWFICDLKTVQQAIAAVKQGRSALSATNEAPAPITFRPEQQEAIARTSKHFGKGKQRMLWNAKMRFGKTLSALQVVKELDLRLTIIVTHRPVVNESWFEDFHKIFYDRPDFAYSSKDQGESLGQLMRATQEQSKEPGRGKARSQGRGQQQGVTHWVYFASLQDLRGSSQVGGTFDKNQEVFTLPWDLVIIDEAHEGTQTQLGQSVLQELVHDDTKVLYLSGTPFNLIEGFKQDEIFTWDYVMEQKAKNEWDTIHQGDPNPYAGLPQLHLYTYHLGELFGQYASGELAFNFAEFFKVDASGHFGHEDDVKAFLNLLTKADNYPFATLDFRAIFRHTLWVLPGVKAAKALSALLKEHPIFGRFTIVNVAGAGDYDENASSLGATEALQDVTDAIGPEPETTYTITLSCGRLTTGVTVKQWTGVLLLAGSYQSSASSYLQTIFRVQSPATSAGKVKEHCYAFDFAPDRALKVLAQAFGVTRSAESGGAKEGGAKAALGAFLNFCPVIAIEGSTMAAVNVGQVMAQIKRVYVEQVVAHGFDDVHLYNDQLMKLDELDLAQFDQLKGIIGETRALGNTGKVELNQQGLTDEEHEELSQIKHKKKRTPEEEERLKELRAKAKVRDNAIAILRGISIRMPLMIYGATINDENKELTIDNFSHLVDDVSWAEFMPPGVTKELFAQYIKYYDPDIFTAAGKRIRALAREADELSIEERIQLISSIFASFRNPDKETVLTPWRVVNLHLSSTIGGYCFYDPKFEHELSEPRLVEPQNITVFTPKTRLLEINSKSGLYPLYLTYTLVRLYLDTYGNKLSLLTRAQQRKLWDDVLTHNIFIICKTPMARAITTRTLVGFRAVPLNACARDDLTARISTERTAVKDLIAQLWPNLNPDMKFDAIVGNPPYQLMDGGSKASAKPLYHHFVRNAKALEPRYISFITPSRWFAGGKGLDDFRAEMLQDHHIRSLVTFANANECFSNTNIAGGINFFLWDRDHAGSCTVTNVSKGTATTTERTLDEFFEYGLFVWNNTAINIIRKATQNSRANLSSLISSRNPFDLSTDKRGDAEMLPGYLKLYSSHLEISYLAPTDELMANPYTNAYKVLISRTLTGRAGQPDKNGKHKVLSSLKVLAPGEICNDSYIVMGCFKHKSEAEALSAYLSTTFARYLLLQAVSSINITRERFVFVPLQDFSDKASIDWSRPVAELDAQLFAQCGLSEEECDEIKSTISPM